MAMERASVLLLCSFVLASVAIVSWNGAQETVLVSQASIAKEQTKLETVENQMMGDTPKAALEASKKAAKLQALIQTQQAMLKAAKPARIQQLSYQYQPLQAAPAWRRTNMLSAAEKPMALNESPQAKQAAETQAAQLAKNLALAEQKQAAAKPVHSYVSPQARQLAQHLHAMHQQAKINTHAIVTQKAGVKGNKLYHPHTNSVWDTTMPTKPENRVRTPVGAAAAPVAAAAPPPGYVAVKALLPGQKLPKGAVELPARLARASL
eukprot:2430060-Rhodomonas_salina.8